MSLLGPSEVKDGSENMHRAAKLFLDKEVVGSIAEAMDKLRSMSVEVHVGPSVHSSYIGQVTLLTFVNLARRSFLGGVVVIGIHDASNLVTCVPGDRLVDAVIGLGARVVRSSEGRFAVYLGDVKAETRGIRLVYSDWRGGIVPAAEESSCVASIPLGAVLSAGIAVNELFEFFQGERPEAGLRSVMMSVWDVNDHVFDVDERNTEPRVEFLPDRLWIVGIGHLGQAYLWLLGVMPYQEPGAVHVVLQDMDRITEANDSTSVLTDLSVVGNRKTWTAANWLKRGGFDPCIVDLPFSREKTRGDDSPRLCLAGVDNVPARRQIAESSFSVVVDAGIGGGADSYSRINLHSLPADREPREIWPDASSNDSVTISPILKEIALDEGLDNCGLMRLAKVSVGVPFVGAVASCLVFGQVLRLLHGAPIDKVVDVDLQVPDYRAAIPNQVGSMRIDVGFQRIRSL